MKKLLFVFLLCPFAAFSQVSLSRTMIQDYASITALRAETITPKNNDKVFLRDKETIMYWLPANVLADDGVNVIKQTNIASGRWVIVIAKVDATKADNTISRAFSKVGSIQATNATAVLDADNIYHTGNVALGSSTAAPTRSLVLNQKTNNDGFQFTGVPLNGASNGTGIIQTMFYNIPGNKQMGFMDADGVGNSAYGCIRVSGAQVMGIDCSNATNNAYYPLGLGAPTGSKIMLGSDNTNTQPSAMGWVNGSMSIGAGVKTVSTTNGLLVQGNTGLGFATPVTKLHVFGNGLAYPATSGTTQSAGHVVRLQGSNNALLDIGGFSTLGFWLQSSDAGNLGVNYPLLINPNGGNVAVGLTVPTSTLHVNGSFAPAIRTVTISYTATISDYTIIANSPAITITLPAASTAIGRIYAIKNISTGNITLTSTSLFRRNGSAGNTVVTLDNNNNATIQVQSDGAQWLSIAFGG